MNVLTTGQYQEDMIPTVRGVVYMGVQRLNRVYKCYRRDLQSRLNYTGVQARTVLSCALWLLTGSSDALPAFHQKKKKFIY